MLECQEKPQSEKTASSRATVLQEPAQTTSIPVAAISGLRAIKMVGAQSSRKMREESYTLDEPSPMAKDGKTESGNPSRVNSQHYIPSRRKLEVPNSHNSSSFENMIVTNHVKVQASKSKGNLRSYPADIKDFSMLFGFKQAYSRVDMTTRQGDNYPKTSNSPGLDEVPPPIQIGNISQPISKIATGTRI